MEIPVLKVQPRNETGKGPAHRLRAGGLIPAVCYGVGKKPLALSINPIDLMTILRGPRGLNALIKLEGAENRTVFVQDFQRHPVDRNLLHVDFLSIDTSKAVRREVPIDFTGKAEGVKIGGILQVALRSVLVEALPAELPDNLTIDTSPLLIGDSLHIADIKLPSGVKAIYEQNYAICSVVAPSEEKAAVEEAAPAEGEEGVVEGAEGEAAVAEGAEGAAGAVEKKAEGDAKPGAEKKAAGEKKPAGKGGKGGADK
jgi:large subunit ribosomal protein L25